MVPPVRLAVPRLPMSMTPVCVIAFVPAFRVRLPVCVMPATAIASFSVIATLPAPAFTVIAPSTLA